MNRNACTLLAVGIATASASAQIDRPQIDSFTSASAGSLSYFDSGSQFLENKRATAESFENLLEVQSGPGGLEAVGVIFFLAAYDLDPWIDFSMTIENHTNETMFITSNLAIGPLAPAAGDTLYNSRISVTGIDGHSAVAADGSASIRSGGTGALAYSYLGGLDSVGFGDGTNIAGAEAGSLSTDLGDGETAESGLLSQDVGLGPDGALDPDAYWGVFGWGFQLAISPGDSALINGRFELIPAPGVASVLVLGGVVSSRRRRA